MPSSKKSSTYTIRLYAGLDLSSATDLEIAYRDPAGIKGDLSAITYGSGNDYVQAEVPDTLNIVAGMWAFEITCTIGGSPYISYETAHIRLKERFS